MPEVWIWQDGAISVHVLDGGRYRAAPRSAALPGLDLSALVEHLDAPSASAAIKGYRARLETGAGRGG